MTDRPDVLNMRELWEKSDKLLRSSKENKTATVRQIGDYCITSVETPMGLVIEEWGDSLHLEAQYEEVRRRSVADVTVSVKFVDIRDQPEVFEEVTTDDVYDKHNVPQRDFASLAQHLNELF